MDRDNTVFTAEALSRAVARELAVRLSGIGIHTEVVSDEHACRMLGSPSGDVRLSAGIGNHAAVPFHTSRGVVYGYARNSTIYLNESRFLPDTPIHEYTHLWLRAMRTTNPDQWQDLMVSARQFPEWDELRCEEPYRHYDMELFTDEVIATAVGRHGGEVISEVASVAMELHRTDLDALIDMTGCAIDTYVAELMGTDLRSVSADSLAAIVLKDMIDIRDIFHSKTEEVDFAAIGRKCADATLSVRSRMKERARRPVAPVKDGSLHQGQHNSPVKR